jgi:hypothetical protein
VSSADEDNLGTRIDHTLINALSASREKFPTSRNIFLFVRKKRSVFYLDHLKKWLREHRSHPYPSNQEKSQLAKQSSITYDQVTTWFNNARAILRRRQAKLRHSVDDDEPEVEEEEEDGESLHENKKRSESSKSKNLFEKKK